MYGNPFVGKLLRKNFKGPYNSNGVLYDTRNLKKINHQRFLGCMLHASMFLSVLKPTCVVQSIEMFQ